MEDPFLPALLGRYLGPGGADAADAHEAHDIHFDDDLFEGLNMDTDELNRLVFSTEEHHNSSSGGGGNNSGCASGGAALGRQQDLLPRTTVDTSGLALDGLPELAPAHAAPHMARGNSYLDQQQQQQQQQSHAHGLYLHQPPPQPPQQAKQQAQQQAQQHARQQSKRGASASAATAAREAPKPKGRSRKRSAANSAAASTDGPAAKVAPASQAPKEASPSASGTTSPTGNGQSTHVEKRRAHNAVERRYRNSINDRITELRSNLPLNWITGPKAKTNKASVLGKGIQFIQELKLRTERLEDENRRLREFIARHSLNPSEVTPAMPLPTTAPAQSQSGRASAATTGGSVNGNNGSEAGSSPHGDSGLSSAPSSRSNSPNNTFSDATRLLMCMVLFGVCILAAPGSAPGLSGGEAAVHGSHGTARILTAAEGSAAAAAASSGSRLTDAALWWGARLLTVLVCLVAMFVREPLSEADTAMAKVAQDHEKKATMSVTLGHFPTAKYHSVKALECLGVSIPASTWRLWLALAWQGLRQGLHRVQVGLVLDRYFTRRTAGHQTAAASAAHASHVLQQMLLAEGGAPSTAPILLCALRAINAAEAAGSAALDKATHARIYVAAAAQAQLTAAAGNSGGQGRLFDRFYLHKASTALPEAERDSAGSIGWALTPAGKRFILGGAWARMTLRDARGQVHAAGTLNQLGLAFRADTLQAALTEYVRGGDVSLVGQHLQALQTCAEEAADGHALWWARAGQTALAWRLGQPAQARRGLLDLERLARHGRDATQRAVYAALLAHQSLVDGDLALCASLLSQASAATADALADHASPRGPGELHVLCQFMALRQLLSTRVALYRLRSYLVASSRANSPEGSAEESEGDASSDASGNFDAMLEALQSDLGMLRAFSEEHPVAEPLALVYRAVCRSLAGGRVAPTQQLFNLACKAARREGVPYDEGLALLHMSACLRGTLSPSTLHRNLNNAASLFERLDAADELTSARKMLKVMGA